MVGELDLAFIGVAFASTAAAAAVVSRRTEEALSTERLISPSDTDEADLVGGKALFHRHVLRWFIALWVVFFVASLWLGDTLGIRGQVVLNLVGIFFGGSLVMIRRYGLDPREAFNLRAPPTMAWPAVLVGAPSTLVLGIGLAEAVNTWLFPVPPELIEAFGRSLVGEGQLPLWQLLLFVAVMPGIFEELAFRGVLVHGLKKQLRPVALALTVGVVFGLFHVSLFRIFPTAWLGIVLTAVTLLTGSVLPAMAWHLLNNAIAIVPAGAGWVSADATLPVWAYPLALVGALVSFGLLWWSRRPLPGMKRQAPERYRS
jgi:membrane protease YdiL (CAAX protease family)